MNGVTLSAQNLVKRYGGVVALSDGNLEVHSGEVVTLVGANGSGKSTLSKIVTGVVAPQGGQLLLNNQPVSFSSPLAARQHGIVAVYQELSLVPRMTVSENIWLGHELVSRSGLVRRQEMRDRTRALLDLFQGVMNAGVEPDTPVHQLAPSDKQIVEILKALSLEPRIMILDEATASLDTNQVKRLFELIGEWKKQGKGIVFISHRLDEIYRIADHITVLRNGKTVASAPVNEIPRRELVHLMIEDVEIARHNGSGPAPMQAEVSLKVENLNTRRLKDINFEVRRGELLGIGGLQGQGQSELLLTLFGAVPYTGSLTVFGRLVQLTSPRRAMKEHIAFVPGDRSTEGLLPVRSILENLMLPSWRSYGFPIRMIKARHDAQQAAQNLKLVMESLDAPVTSLSGGNAQKVVLGKWLLRSPKILLLDDPTKGVDVGAKGEFYKLLTELRNQGTSILFYSSDDEELLGLCDRILVLQDGQITAELQGESLTHYDLVAASMGSTGQELPYED